jgi:hypothetical protein
MARRLGQYVTDFRSGEVSPRTYMRVDQADWYNSACKEITDWIVRPQGGVHNRSARQYPDWVTTPWTDGDDDSEKIRVIPFSRGGAENDFQVVFGRSFGTDRIWFEQEGSGVLSSITPPNGFPWTDSQIGEIQWAQSQQGILLVHPEVHPHWIKFNPRLDAFRWSFQEQPRQFIPDIRTDDTGAPGSTDAIYQIKFGNHTSGAGSWHTQYYNGNRMQFGGTFNGRVIRWRYEPEGDPVKYFYRPDRPSGGGTIDQGNVATMERRIRSLFENAFDLNPGEVSVSHNSIVSTFDTYDVTISGAFADADFNIWPDSNAVALGASLGTSFPILEDNTQAGAGTEEPAWSYPYVVQNGSNYYQCDEPHTSAAATEPGVGASWQTVWTDLGTTAPDWWDWQHEGSNPWTTDTVYSPWDRGFPSVVTFYQQRAVVASSPGFPVTIWGSRAGNEEYFRQGVQSTDSWQFTINTRDSARLTWLDDIQGLIAGSTAGDYLLGENITPNNPPTGLRVTARKSEAIQPVTVGPEIIYVEQGGKKLRRLLRSEALQGFDSDDISFAQDHIAGRRIAQVAVQHMPETIIWMRFADRSVSGIAYDRQASVNAWFDLSFQADDISVSFDSATNEEKLWIVDTQVKFGAQRFATEVTWMPFKSDYRFDIVTTGTGGPATGTGLNSLYANFAYWALERADSDSAWEFVEIGTLDASGEATINFTTGYEYALGVRYDALLETLEPLFFGAKRRWSDLYLRLNESVRPFINDEPVDDSYEVVTGDFEVNTLGFARKGAVTIRQNFPLPTEVTGIYGNIVEGNE